MKKNMEFSKDHVFYFKMDKRSKFVSSNPFLGSSL